MTKIIRYNPWAEMAALNRWMAEAANGASNGPSNGNTARNGWNVTVPAVDVKETPEGYEFTAALPGWKSDDIDVTIEKGVLTLKGELKDEKTETPAQPSTAKWHSREIRRSSFVRSFSLPAEVQSDKAAAQFDNGVLTLTLPKAEVVKPKQIKIAVNNGKQSE